MRAALATALLGERAELERLAVTRWPGSALLARFQAYSDRWRQQGFMVALQELLAEEQVPARLLRGPTASGA